MNINLSKKQIAQIRQALSFFYDKSMSDSFDAAVKLSESKEIINPINPNKKLDTTQNHKKLFRSLDGKFLPAYNQLAKFIYNSPTTGMKIRLIKVDESNKDYLMGVDLLDENKQKSFRKDRVVGGIYYFKQKIFYSTENK